MINNEIKQKLKGENPLIRYKVNGPFQTFFNQQP